MLIKLLLLLIQMQKLIERDFISIKPKLSKKLYKLLWEQYLEEASRLCNLMLKEYVKDCK